jgi:hypothetical protein
VVAAAGIGAGAQLAAEAAYEKGVSQRGWNCRELGQLQRCWAIAQ